MFVAVGGTTLVLSNAALCRLNDASLEIPDGPGVAPRDIRLGVAERPEGPGVEGAREREQESRRSRIVTLGASGMTWAAKCSPACELLENCRIWPVGVSSY